MKQKTKFKQTETGKIPEDWKAKAFSHTFNELEIPNMFVSINTNFEKIQKVHDSIHKFLFLASLCLPHDKSWHQKSAYLTYQLETFNSAHRSFLEALAGYYNIAFTLLRSVQELIVKGAFFECLAHKEYREKAEVLDKDKKGRCLKDTICKAISSKPNLEIDLERTSVIIHDMLMVSVDDKIFIEQLDYLPSIKTIIEQLSAWEMLKPIEKSVESIYNIYKKLSADVHVIPDKTDVGRKFLSGKDLFEVNVIPSELNAYLEILHKLIDISIVIELNILSDWIIKNDEIQNKFTEQLSTLKDLELFLAYQKLNSLVMK